MKCLMKILLTTVSILLFIGCGKAEIPSVVIPNNPTTPATVSNPESTPDVVAPAVVDATPTPTPTPDPGAPTVSITYYQLTKTITPNAAFPAKTYTATGYCTTYSGDKYCWDDGKKTIIYSGTPFIYSYFNMSKNVVGYSHSSGGMQEDLMLAPTILVPLGGLPANITAGAVNEVFSSATSTTVTCTEATNGNLDCGSFTIDVNQTAI